MVRSWCMRYEAKHKTSNEPLAKNPKIGDVNFKLIILHLLKCSLR